MAITGSTGDTTYGIELTWGNNTVDSSSGYVNPYTEVQRTTTTPPTTAWTRVAVVRFINTTYRDELPADGTRRYYRIRHTLPGFVSSTWLGEVDALPVELGEGV